MSDITIVFTNYKRREQLLSNINLLRSIAPSYILKVWDNSPDQDFPCDVVDELYRSSINLSTSPRWWVAAQASTKYVAVMDDDLSIGNTLAVGRCIARIEDGAKAVGFFGVKLNGSKYSAARHVFREDAAVDIIKGRFFCTKTSNLKSIPAVPLYSEDDIIISSFFKGDCFTVCPGGDFLRETPGGFALSDRTDHMVRRNRTSLEYFPECYQ